MSPAEFCHDKVVKSKSNFTIAFALLNGEKREAMETLYAYCREIDDIADSCLDPKIAKEKLNWWEDEIRNVFGSPTHPISIALQKQVANYSLPISDLLKIIFGVSQDLDHKPFRSFVDLENYSDCVAGAVGRLAARIFGKVINTEVLNYATELGIACQFTNILRDISEDRENSRVYVPLELLQKYNLRFDQNSSVDKKKTEPMFEEFYVLTKEKYKNAFLSLPKENYKEQRPGIVMGVIYMSLLKKIKKLKFNVLERKISLNTIEKLWAASNGAWGKIPGRDL
tara:strand:- start:1373 stop:2221 length:849 start_codon:yes stop_codon:yes gene_type:complete